MNSLVMVNICIVLLHILNLIDLTTADVLGGSACRYSGNFDKGNQICHKDVVKLKYLPKECTSYVFDGVICNQDYSIVYRWIPEDIDHLQSLIDYDDKKYPVFVFYKHRTVVDWTNAIFLGDFPTEAQYVNNFIKRHPVKGLILDGFDNPLLFECGNFYHNFTNYVAAIKRKNKKLSIGLYLSARHLVESVNMGVNSTWFDFRKLNKAMDFYLIEFATFNNCSEEFLHSGITPLASSKSDVMTLNKFADALKLSPIKKEKIYFEFLISPMPIPTEIPKIKHCRLSYNEYCENHNGEHGKWCIDNQNSLFAKGKFAREFSKGFVARDIDLVDRDEKCKCDNQFITFFMLLNGYKNGKDPITCKALKGS